MTHDIKALRLAQSMSQKRLAREAGIAVRTLRRIESGVDVSPESYRAVCVALKIDPTVSIDEPLIKNPPSMAFGLASGLDNAMEKSSGFARTVRGKTIIATVAVSVAVCAAPMVRAWWFRPNVSVTIAFDRSCEELGVWSKAFSAMDREFPDGYSVKGRIDGAKDCAYTFEGYYAAVGPLDPKLANLVRDMEHVGSKTTVTFISEPHDVTPRPKDFWDKEKRITPDTVQSFSIGSYKRVYRLNPEYLDGDIAYARGLFADQASFDGYVESLKSSGNLEAIAKYGLAISVLTSAPSLTEKGTDDIWTVKFRSKIRYSGMMALDQCLNATVRLKETNSELGILNIVSEPSACHV